MPRNHKRKPATRRYADYTEDTLAEALRVLKSKSMSLREASKKYKISWGTLSRKLKNKNMNKYGRPTVLTEQEEQKIVEGLQVAGGWGFPLTTTDLQLVRRLSRTNLRAAVPQLASDLDHPAGFPPSPWAAVLGHQAAATMMQTREHHAAYGTHHPAAPMDLHVPQAFPYYRRPMDLHVPQAFSYYRLGPNLRHAQPDILECTSRPHVSQTKISQTYMQTPAWPPL
ncbi:unnamed protein product [Phaedon cochleariae]|uniref:HTH psq-type domain-containing protein n=1 Tax=Phaedon cochleariae TaxID=80249 RepID=A0A9N9SEF6_PHACE|nr:unnamed protein product [Phaedon cochleariae]